MSKCGSITVENLKVSITTELNADVLDNFFTYTMPFAMPGYSESNLMTITTENLKTSITTECNG